MASEATAVEHAAKPEGFKRTRKDRLLMQIKSLDDNDDERTSISKRISWLLRHGAKLAGVAQEEKTKWVKLTDLCESEILKEFTPDLIWKVIVDFNGKKLRYEIDEQPAGGTRLRSYKRDPDNKGGPRKGDVVPTKGDGSLRMDAPAFAPAGVTAAAPTASTAGAAPPTQAAVQQAQQAAAMAAYQQMMFNPMMMGMMNPYMWQQAAAAAGKYVGTIKSFNQQKGFGFIECQQTYSQYHRDVFLHKAQIGELQVGAAVQFSCEVNKNGMPQAMNVHAAGAPPPPGKGKDFGKGKGKGKGKDGKDGKKGKGEGKGKKGGDKNNENKEEAGEKADGAGEAAAEAPAEASEAPAEGKPAEAAPAAAESS